jgi:hypothetical protein
VVEPHHPDWEQQFPNAEPAQPAPVVPPQVPSRETAVGLAIAVEVEVAVVVVETLDAMEPAELRYQLAAGSPRHSPTVTVL